ANRSEVVIRGELSWDASFAAAGVAGAPVGRRSFELQPGAELVVPLRMLAPAAGQAVTVSVGGLVASDRAGQDVAVQVPAPVNIVVGRP
ncbi:MAG: hypothetical protein ACKVQR_11920, partial [Aquabacterium sp.]